MRAYALAIASLLLALSRVDAGPAENLTDEAFAAAQRKDWETARTKFEQAYALEPKPVTLYNLAAAQQNTKRLLAARDSYSKFLVDSDDPRFRQRAREALTRLQTAIPTLTIVLRGAANGATVAIDGAPAQVGSAIAVDPGPRVITVLRGSTTVATQSITLAENAREQVELVVPVPPVERDEKRVERPEPTPAPAPEPHGRSALRSPWLWAVIAGVAVGASVTYWGVVRPESDPTRGTLGPGMLPSP